MTDVLLYQSNDFGDINVVNGVVELSGGLETFIYLCMFGGNRDDDGSQDTQLGWWGNIDEIEPAKKYRSRTQYLLASMPLTTANLQRIEDAVRKDLSILTDEGIASSFEVTASIPGLNKIKIAVSILAEGDERSFVYIENWRVEL